MQKLYTSPKACEEFTKRQNNPSHASISSVISAAVDKVRSDQNSILNLSGRGNPQFFEVLLSQFTESTWLVPSEAMKEIAERNGQSTNITQFAIGTPQEYLESLENDSIQLAFMKHTFAEIHNLEDFFHSLYNKLQIGGKFIANVSDRSTLKRHSSNGSYFIDGELVPEEGTELEDGQAYTVKFFQTYQEPNSGYITDGELNFYYYSLETIKEIAESTGFHIDYLGPQDQYVQIETPTEVNTNLLVITKTD